MDYGQLFSRAWKICWDNKWLFLLGFLAALGAGGGGSYNYQFGSGDVPFAPGALSPEFQRNFEAAFAAAVPLLVGLACFGFILAIALWLLRLTTQAGMIRAANDADAGQKIALGKAFSDGMRYLPRFIGVNLLFYLPLIVLGVVSTVIFIFTFAGTMIALLAGSGTGTQAIGGAAGLGILCVCLLLCLTIPLGIVINILYPFAQRAVVLEGQGVIASVRRAWGMFKANLSETLVLILLYIAIGIVFGVLSAIVIIPLALLISLPSMTGVFFTSSFDAGSLIFSTLGLFILGVIGALLMAVWTAFRSVSFTLAYAQFAARTPIK